MQDCYEAVDFTLPHF